MPLNDPMIADHGVSLYVKRDDLTHTQVSGNKWRKLKYNLQQAKTLGLPTLLTFGGAYSNHIHAVAMAGQLFGFRTVGVIRGEEHLPLNPTLSFARSCGMELHYLDRATFRLKDDPEVRYQLQQALEERYGPFYWVPMGGTNTFALPGVAEVIGQLEGLHFDYLCTACGTGGTLAGLVSGDRGKHQLLGFPALKGADFLYDDIRHLLAEAGHAYDNWALQLDYHFGGYAKHTPELLDFIRGVRERTGLPLEPIYTGKMCYGVYDLIRQGFFKRGETVVLLHTGGLQVNPDYGGHTA